MDKTTAQRLVRDTFKAAFDKQRCRDFINELCNGFDEAKAQNMGVPDAFAPHVRSCQRLGTFTAADGELADVLIVHLTESDKLERTRTALRDFVAHKLKRGEGDGNSYKEASLVAFVAPDSQSWRFSYVRMEYETKRDPKTGKIKAEERLTPARRFSYLVGADEECHTAQSRFLALLQNTSDKPTLAQIEEAFSIESVTKEFFGEYARLFQDTESALADVVKRDKTLRDEFKAKDVSTVDFAKKLIGQSVFLYFIQKKGWLGVPKGGQWGDGPRNFLRQLANRAISEKKCLFNDVLEPLFYDTLATDRGHEAWCKTFACRIPFLNGGLFEPLAGYDWEKTEIDLPNALFTNQTRTDAGDVGSGILDVFDRYNFTVNEAEPLEMEVAIDPEMLGKVFENLIEENRRKGLGAFYSPREIVHFMCQESLINYLDVALNHPTTPIGAATPQPDTQPPLFADSSEKPKARAAQEEFTDVRQRVLIARKDLVEWISRSDQFAHYAAAIAAGMKGGHYPKPPESIRKFAREIDALLRDITVCDPAIGSGAFPVGMMTEIVRARMALTPYFNDVAERTAYHFKRHAIQNSIYGVDIDAGAVEVAKLRLWLSLVVDEDDVQQIKPLPNLDYKIVVGNSLLGFPFKSQRVQRIEKLKTDYFDETDHEKKKRLKREIDSELVQAFAASEASLGYEVSFDFHIYFSEVFRTKKGFDVVIANPPYGANIDSQIALLARLYPETTKEYKDVFKIFIELGLTKLTATSGTLCYIVPNTLLLQPRYKDARQFLLKHSLVEVVNLGEEVFETVVVPTCVVIVQHGTKSTSSLRMRNVAKNSKFAGDLRAVAPIAADQTAFQSAPDFVFTDKLRAKKTNEVELAEIMDLKDCGIKYQRTNVGLAKKGGNDLWERLFYTGKKQHPNDVRYITGSELNRSGWRIDFSKDQYFRHNYRALLRPNEIVYFNKDVFDLPAKIVWRQTSSYFVGAFLGEGVWFGNTLQAGVLKPHYEKKFDLRYLLALLNSMYLRHLYINIVQEMGRVFPQVKLSKLKGLPIKDIPREQQEPFVKLVEQITSIAEDDDYLEDPRAQAKVHALEGDIDRLVYKLYDVSTEEIKGVEASAKPTGRAKR